MLELALLMTASSVLSSPIAASSSLWPSLIHSLKPVLPLSLFLSLLPPVTTTHRIWTTETQVKNCGPKTKAKNHGVSKTVSLAAAVYVSNYSVVLWMASFDSPQTDLSKYAICNPIKRWFVEVETKRWANVLSCYHNHCIKKWQLKVDVLVYISWQHLHWLPLNIFAGKVADRRCICQVVSLPGFPW